MLLYEEAKAFEKTIGPEATEILAKVFERQESSFRDGLATREDLLALRAELKQDNAALRAELKENIANTRHDLLKWMVGGNVALGALFVAVMAFLR